MRSKVTAQTEEIELLSADKERVQGLESKVALLKASVARKDSILGALKSQVSAAEEEFKLYKGSADETANQASRKIKELGTRIREGEGERKEEEDMRVRVLEDKKESLQEELAGIKGSMYEIMGDLYSANQKARGSPSVGGGAGASVGGEEGGGGGGGGGGSSLMEKLDAGRLEQISSMLDLSANEMQDIFEVSGAGGAEGGGGRGGGEDRSMGGERGGDKQEFMGTLEEALDLSGERSVDVERVMNMGKNLVSSIANARAELE